MTIERRGEPGEEARVLFSAASWFVLIGVAWSVGAAILGRLERHVVFDRVGDRFLGAVWLGVIVLANAWLATSFMVLLTPLAGAGGFAGGFVRAR